jgi:hypothetical protein
MLRPFDGVTILLVFVLLVAQIGSPASSRAAQASNTQPSARSKPVPPPPARRGKSTAAVEATMLAQRLLHADNGADAAMVVNAAFAWAVCRVTSHGAIPCIRHSSTSSPWRRWAAGGGRALAGPAFVRYAKLCYSIATHRRFPI